MRGLHLVDNRVCWRRRGGHGFDWLDDRRSLPTRRTRRADHRRRRRLRPRHRPRFRRGWRALVLDRPGRGATRGNRDARPRGGWHLRQYARRRWHQRRRRRGVRTTGPGVRADRHPGEQRRSQSHAGQTGGLPVRDLGRRAAHQPDGVFPVRARGGQAHDRARPWRLDCQRQLDRQRVIARSRQPGIRRQQERRQPAHA